MVSARKITTCHLNCSLVYGWVMWKICVPQIFIIKSREWHLFNYNAASAAVDGLLNIIMDSLSNAYPVSGPGQLTKGYLEISEVSQQLLLILRLQQQQQKEEG